MEDLSKEILNVERLKVRWNCCEATVHNRRKKDGLPYFRLGRLLYFRLSDVLEYERARLKTDKEAVA
jgi:hypothetical protein